MSHLVPASFEPFEVKVTRMEFVNLFKPYAPTGHPELLPRYSVSFPQSDLPPEHRDVHRSKVGEQEYATACTRTESAPPRLRELGHRYADLMMMHDLMLKRGVKPDRMFVGAEGWIEMRWFEFIHGDGKPGQALSLIGVDFHISDLVML